MANQLTGSEGGQVKAVAGILTQWRVVTLTALLFAANFCRAFPPAPFPKSSGNRREESKLRGVWEIVTVTHEGRAVLLGPTSLLTVVIEDRRMRIFDGHRAVNEWILVIHPCRSPQAIDQRSLVDGGAAWGIFKATSDTLTICYCDGSSSKCRPTSFHASAPGVWVEVYRRRKSR